MASPPFRLLVLSGGVTATASISEIPGTDLPSVAARLRPLPSCRSLERLAVVIGARA